MAAVFLRSAFVLFVLETGLVLAESQFPVSLSNVKLRDCGSFRKKIDFQNLTLSSTKKGEIQLSGIAEVHKTLDGRLDAEVILWRNGVRTPCFQSIVGTCKYRDICEKSQNHVECPNALNTNMKTCACPYHEGSYILKDFTVELKNIKRSAHSYLDGDFTVLGVVRENRQYKIGCFTGSFKVEVEEFES